MIQSTAEQPLSSTTFTLSELAVRVGGFVEGDSNVVVLGISSIEEAQSGDVVFAENPRFLIKAGRSNASAIVVQLDAEFTGKPLIRVDNPRLAFSHILELFKPDLHALIGIHPSAVTGCNLQLGSEVSIGPNVTLGDDVKVGARTIILPGCCIGDRVSIGEDCLIHPNVTINFGCNIGNGVIIHSGAVLGSDGFGYMPIGDKACKVPHIGNVEICDEVEIGANVTIDRAKTGSTIIGERTKIDNLVHIAHNVKIGPDCIIVAQVGIAGSTTLGQRVTIAGQTGVKDHIHIGDNVMVMGQAGVWGDVESNQIISGNPARAHRHRMRVEAAMDKLPDYVKLLKQLESENSSLREECVRLVALLGRIAQKVDLEDAS